MSNQGKIEKIFISKPLDEILKRLHPYKPSKFIIGEYYLTDSMIWYSIQNDEYNYRGIPIEVVDDEYYLDFEM